MIFSFHKNAICVKVDEICGKGADALCIEDMNKIQSRLNLYLIEIKETKSERKRFEALKRIENTLKVMKTKPGKVLIIYENESQTLENQTFIKKVKELKKNFKVKIVELLYDANSVKNDVIEAARKLR